MPNDPVGIVPFRQFVDSLSDIRPEQHVGVALSRARDVDAVEQMRNYLVSYYGTAEAPHSYVDDNGSVFDFIPIEQQPALRSTGAGPATPPDLPQPPPAAAAAPTEQRTSRHVIQLHPYFRDRYGNQMSAPAGTIPVRRLTVENLTRFETLQHFFQKSPYGSAPPPHPSSPSAPMGPGGSAPPGGPGSVPATHRWAHAYQAVDNLGGHSFLNVWDPPIGANQVFSLSQHWYVGGSGGNLQTAEVGWQVYPQLYGNTNPVFFIYWTADNYSTTGCYNLSCKAFVQTNSAWAIGGAISPSSVPGGQQQEIEVSYYLTGGNWWLYVGGGAASNAIGYYPASQYRGGAMATKASECDYGGEVVGTTSWPPMGSGVFANQGWQHAAYQRDIRYFPAAGGNVSAQLTATTTSPRCYTAQVNMYNPSWNETLWYGGPGGNNC
jgi:Neprosin